MQKLTALVVDAAAGFREQAKSILTAAGFNVEVAENGQQALTLASAGRFRLICCSDDLPDIAGSDFCGQLRALDGYDYAAVLIMTDNDNARKLKQALLAGATDIFNKHDTQELEIYVRRLAERETRHLSGRVLFIEDSRVLQTIIIDLLTDMGLDVDAYTFAEEAWAAFSGGDYDLVITDIMLEGSMSGITLVRKIRRLREESGNLPIIATSGFDNMSRKIELFQLGVNDFVSKPINREELRQRVFNHITSYQNVRELRAQQNSLYSLAMLDQLTQLFNRHALREFAGKYFSEAYRFNRTLSMAVLDLDHFRDLNDKYGHDKGDQVLAELGNWLKRHVRDEDMIARWAGEEFVMLLPGCDAPAAVVLMQRMQKRLQRFKPANMTISLSVGVAEMRHEPQDNLNTLFELADRAMYQAKMAGRNCVRQYQTEEGETL
ncbi:Pas [Methylophaga frappieri]|uniref:diguanylate cyclase n=1 Tax=Methylophaga frappieri (strain ATCC BAA-2434 / DSM 25690 / JAM7) TaxID=754477 RepID=I1YIU0_METFJ|nr:diguanylate cyclase [Methylophaga frappieri]AFJ02833.1 Pas [Methylophaga frappieri]